MYKIMDIYVFSILLALYLRSTDIKSFSVVTDTDTKSVFNFALNNSNNFIIACYCPQIWVVFLEHTF